MDTTDNHLRKHTGASTPNLTEDNHPSASNFTGFYHVTATQPNAEMSWEPVAKRAMTAQDEWRKEYCTIKAAHELTITGWKSIAERAMHSQNEWRKEYSALRADGPKIEEPKLRRAVVRELVEGIRAKTVTSNERGCQTKELGSATESKLKEKDDTINELRADAAERLNQKENTIDELRANAAKLVQEKDQIIDGLRADEAKRIRKKSEVIDEPQPNAAEREAVHSETTRRLERKIRQMHREAQSHQSLVANMQNEILRRDKALERLLKESQQFRDSD